ncbi:MAG: DNA repair protein RecN [Clostridia bacterium]|nr:DNA repair protein RecN [Clostridia bacterium]
MLKNLFIKNIALIASQNIEFEKGLCVLSGETGAGKSIIVDALSFVLGERADKNLIKYGEETAFVEAAFELESDSRALNALEDMGFDRDTTLILSRSLNRNGKSESRINGRISATGMLKSLTSLLVDIFGQSEHLGLIKPENHLKILDGYAPAFVLKEKLSSACAEFKELEKELEKYGGSDEQRERLLDILSFQINEIESAGLGEDEEMRLLEQKRKILNFEKISSAVGGAIAALNGEDGAVERIVSASQCFAVVSGLGETFSSVCDRLDALRYEAEDIVSVVEDMAGGDEYDPKYLDEIEYRLDKIKSLKKKYGATVSEIFEFLKDAQRQYDSLSDSARITEKLNERKNLLKNEIYDLSLRLSEHRRLAAEKFAAEVVGQLRELGMNTSFAARFEEAPALQDFVPHSNGFDKMEFMLSANAGEPLKPMSKVASGGEMSRFMLALKNITASIEKIPTMVFDEIDTGISGNVAQMVAKKLAQASRKEQCIVITHLPQIAAMSDAGYLIEKREKDGKTSTTVTRLNAASKTAEISRLIGGAEIGAYGGLHAQEMIDWADEFKKGLL